MYSAASDRLKRRIGEMLIEEGLISESQLAEALKIQQSRGGRTVEILVSLGHIEIDSFVRFLSRQPGIASIDLSNYEIPNQLVQLVPRDFAVKHEVFPIDKLGRLLTVGMACPLDSETVGKLEKITGLKVKPLLCSPQDIRSTIERYYPADEQAAAENEHLQTEHSQEGFKSALKLENVAGMLRQLESLPALPDTVERVREVMAEPDSSTRDVADVIAMDPAIAAKILSLANSAAYGFPHEVNTIERATTLLGLRETYSVVLSCAVIDLLKGSKTLDYRHFWENSLFCAGTARFIAEQVGLKQRAGVFAAGLLRDLGRLALAEVVPELYDKIDPGCTGQALIEEEERVLGIAHPEAGFVLADHWGLPEDMTEAIRFHHRLDLATKAPELAAVVCLATAVTAARTRGADKLSYFLQETASAQTILHIDENRAAVLLEKALAPTAPEEF